MNSKNPRFVALNTIKNILSENPSEVDSYVIDDLAPKDRALYKELTQGTLREWFFLENCIGRVVSKKPKRKMRIVISLGLYQMLFLERVPIHAIYSETKKLGQKAKFSPAEQRFMVAVLKRVEEKKDAFLKERKEALDQARDGKKPDAFGLDVLNCTESLFDQLSWKDTSVAIKALASMKSKSKLFGYSLNEPGNAQSKIAPRAMVLNSEQIADIENYRVQGEASQWACEIAAKLLKGKKTPSVLELSTGKGGKLLGTLAAMKEINELYWVASDPSQTQLAYLNSEVLPIIEKRWPKVKVEVTSEVPSKKFDMVWIDAPCTGFGTLSKLPEIAITRGTDAKKSTLDMVEIQKKLVDQAVSLLKKDGTLIYSVCTLTKPETSDMADYIEKHLKKKPQIKEWLWSGQDPAPNAEGFFVTAF